MTSEPRTPHHPDPSASAEPLMSGGLSPSGSVAGSVKLGRPRRRFPLHVLILIALVVGVAIGLGVHFFWTPNVWESLGVQDSAAFLEGKSSETNAEAGFVAHAARVVVRLADAIGKLFLNALRMIAVPIVVTSLVVAIASLGSPGTLGRLGGRTIAVFLFTGVVSTIIGLVVAGVVQPGSFVDEQVREQLVNARAAEVASRVKQAQEAPGVWRQLIDLIPINPFKALAEGQFLQIIIASLALGVGLILIPKASAEPVVRFFAGLTEAVTAIVRLLMWAAPLAVLCLMASAVATLGLGVLGGLVAYCLAVVGGLGIILFVLYPCLTLLLTPRGNKVGWGRFFRALAPAQFLAFSSSSSAATLPVTIACTKRLGVSDRVTSFVCSLGTTINMDGTALYQAIAAGFLAQIYGVDLSMADRITISIMATLVAIGSPGVPGGSITLMALVLQSVSIPVEGIALVLAVDRLLDMSRTVVNVSGDAAAAAVVAGWERELLTEEQARARSEAEGREIDSHLHPHPQPHRSA
ncbi:MAG: dicarboxylate/amino acid:cation symporter [Planctomycetota bacterium]|nr:dicarboxylate/amino acid:cation symporter [Planctomycetota bacterium]